MKLQLKKRWKVMKAALHMELREHKSSFIVYMTLRVMVILMMILQFFNKNYENVFLCILTLLLLIVPSLIQINLKIELPTALEITILIFIFAAEILGEIQSYYIKVPSWDTALHTINGFLMAAIGFALVDILNQSKKVSMKLSPLFVAIVAFCFSMTIGVVWEFLNSVWIRCFIWICRKIRSSIRSTRLCLTRQEAMWQFISGGSMMLL